MEEINILTSGILKSVDSSFHQNYNSQEPLYYLKYKGEILRKSNGVRLFKKKGGAKSFVLGFVKEIFRQGEYWQKYKDNIKGRIDYEVDYSETIRILPQYGLTSRFETKEAKDMFKKITTLLLEDDVFQIEKL